MEAIKAGNLEELHRAGISKSTSHVFVYRYPESGQMPAMDFREFSLDVEKKARELAFYAHIPYCSGICGYCHYYKQAMCGKKEVGLFLDSLKKEIVNYRNLLGGEMNANSVLFGGGTPTMLEACQLEELILFLQSVFPMEKKTEATLESSPETLGIGKLSRLRQNFNRLSIVVQDFNDSILRACGRNHSGKQAVGAFEAARDSGFGNINIDLIYGLPGQGMREWETTLEEIERLGPESVTASDLRVQKGTGFFSMGKEKFASENELIRMHSYFMEKMLSLGYKQDFPYQFSREGKGMRFLENQWSDGEFVGFGPSSCSFVSGWDYNNVFPTGEYVKAVRETGFGCAVGKKLEREEAMVRMVALGLKNVGFGGVDKALFRKKFGVSIEAEFGEKIGLLEGLGLLENNEKRLGLSARGILFYDAVSRKFFP